MIRFPSIGRTLLLLLVLCQGCLSLRLLRAEPSEEDDLDDILEFAEPMKMSEAGYVVPQTPKRKEKAVVKSAALALIQAYENRSTQDRMNDMFAALKAGDLVTAEKLLEKILVDEPSVVNLSVLIERCYTDGVMTGQLIDKHKDKLIKLNLLRDVGPSYAVRSGTPRPHFLKSPNVQPVLWDDQLSPSLAIGGKQDTAVDLLLLQHKALAQKVVATQQKSSKTLPEKKKQAVDAERQTIHNTIRDLGRDPTSRRRALKTLKAKGSAAAAYLLDYLEDEKFQALYAYIPMALIHIGEPATLPIARRLPKMNANSQVLAISSLIAIRDLRAYAYLKKLARDPDVVDTHVKGTLHLAITQMERDMQIEGMKKKKPADK